MKVEALASSCMITAFAFSLFGCATAVSPSGKSYGLTYPDRLNAVEIGEGREALAFYHRIAEELEGKGAVDDAAQAYLAAAWTARRLGAYQLCIRSGRRAEELMRNTNSYISQDSLQTTALCHRAVGELSEAQRLLKNARSLALGDPSPYGPMRAAVYLFQLAAITLDQGDTDDALRGAQAAAQTLEEIATRAGTGAPRAGDLNLRDLARRNAATALALVADIELAHQRFAEAEAAAERGLVYARMRGFAEGEAPLEVTLGGIALAKDDTTAALRYYADALALATKIGSVPLLIDAHTGLAQTLRRQGQTAQAREHIAATLRLIEDLRSDLWEPGLRSGFLEDKQALYALAIDLALITGDSEDAFGYAERSRARAFLDLLGNQAALSKGTTRTLVEEELRLHEQLAAVQTGLALETGDVRRFHAAADTADRAYRAFLERVRKDNAEQASLLSVEPVTLRDVQAMVPRGTSLLEYFVSDAGITVWIIERDRSAVVRIPTRRADVVADVGRFRSAIADRGALDDVEHQARGLYDRLLAPAVSEVRGDRLMIVPHDVLHYVPFGALRTPAGRWLIEEYGISTLPSASVLKYLSSKGIHASSTVLAIGNPDVGAALALRWAEREARLVGRRYPDAHVLIGAQATEALVKQLSPAAGIIHLATHAELNETDPLASALLLVPGDGEDGRLEVREVLRLELSARLIVLSACETGLGRLSRGDELVGLQRAFLYAGTPAIVTTLWKVEDRASYELVRSFYDYLGAAGPADALRQAQMETLRTYPHPFAWAGFGLSGAPQ